MQPESSAGLPRASKTSSYNRRPPPARTILGPASLRRYAPGRALDPPRRGRRTRTRPGVEREPAAGGAQLPGAGRLDGIQEADGPRLLEPRGRNGPWPGMPRREQEPLPSRRPRSLVRARECFVLEFNGSASGACPFRGYLCDHVCCCPESSLTAPRNGETASSMSSAESVSLLHGIQATGSWLWPRQVCLLLNMSAFLDAQTRWTPTSEESSPSRRC